MLVGLEKQPLARHWTAKAALMSIIMIGTSVVVQAKFGPFAKLPAITTDEERANTLADYYQNPATRIVLVGSSLTYRLTQQYFNVGGVRNIALSGTSSLTGMRIVSSQAVLPEILLVETNVLVWPPDEHLIAQFSRSAFNTTPLRIRPIRTLLASFVGRTPKALNEMYRERMPALLRQPPGEEPPLPAPRSEGQPSPDLPEGLMRRNAHDIVALALDLEARGTKVFLFQVPAARGIFNSVQMQNTRRFLREEVGDRTNLQMDLTTDESELRWLDGAHLDERSAILVIRAIEKWLLEHSSSATD
jgi:hypothetical protein